jgi:hypothetical protein
MHFEHDPPKNSIAVIHTGKEAQLPFFWLLLSSMCVILEIELRGGEGERERENPRRRSLILSPPNSLSAFNEHSKNLKEHLKSG